MKLSLILEKSFLTKISYFYHLLLFTLIEGFYTQDLGMVKYSCFNIIMLYLSFEGHVKCIYSANYCVPKL